MHEYDLLPKSEQSAGRLGSEETISWEKNPRLQDDGSRQKDERFRRGLRVLIIAVSSPVLLVCLLVFLRTRDVLSSRENLANKTVADDMRLQIIIPSFTPHFPVLLDMLHSMACLVTDIDSINIAVILSSTTEVDQLASLLALPSTENCTSSFLNYNTTHTASRTYPPLLTLTNLHDIVPASIQNLTTPNETNDTSSLTSIYRKYKYQTMKKLAGAAYFEYDYAILLDSEGFVIRPVAMKEMVREWAEGPIIWKELTERGSPRRVEWMEQVSEASAHVLGRTMESFGVGVSFWEGYTWILEKEIVMDMVNSPSKFDPGVDFFTRLLNAPSDVFDTCVYKLHIAARKEEQSSMDSTIYTKYRVLDMKDAVLSFGLEAAYNHIPSNLNVIAEQWPCLLLEESLQDLVVEFMKEYKFYFMCFHKKYIDMLPVETVKSFLRKAPVAMVVSDSTGLEGDIISSSQLEREGEWTMEYVNNVVEGG